MTGTPAMNLSLHGQVAIVTGAGHGLGAAYAHELARRGAVVVVNDLLGSPDAEGVVTAIERDGGRAIVAYGDVGTRGGARSVVEETVSRFGTVDILVNNAGIIRPALFEDHTDDHIDSVINVHVRALFYVTQPAYAVMQRAGYGRVVNISSNNSFGVEGMISYCTAKSAVLGFSNALALEAIRHGIFVNSVMPNAVTPMALEATKTSPVPRLEDNHRFLAAYGAVMHCSEPSRPAALVAFLASPECRVTGRVFSQVGPRYARVFFGVTDGWMSPTDEPPTAENIVEHFEELSSTAVFTTPESVTDDFAAVQGRLPA